MESLPTNLMSTAIFSRGTSVLLQVLLSPIFHHRLLIYIPWEKTGIVMLLPSISAIPAQVHNSWKSWKILRLLLYHKNFKGHKRIRRFRFPRWRKFWTRDITNSCVVWRHAFKLKFRRWKQTWKQSFWGWPLTCVRDGTFRRSRSGKRLSQPP